MSGTRLTRKVTVEGSKKLSESVSSSSTSSSGGMRRLSVFERLGPGTTDRPKVREPRESYPLDKCRNWLRDGRCPFGRNCKFLHGPFSEPKQRQKSVRSVVRSDLGRSEERDDERLGGRSQSLDSLEADDAEERMLPMDKKKHKSFEESPDTAKRSGKVKKKPQVDRESSDGEEAGNEERKKKKKAKKRQPSGAVVITKPQSPGQKEGDWGYDDFEEGRSDLDWEEQGELDYERQLMLEKRRQDLQRQLALMDEEEAAIEKAERKVRDVKKEREDEPRSVPVVHSRLHPEKASVSPGDEVSSVSSQSTPKKKKKKSDGEAKKLKPKRKLSPSSKEFKKRKALHVCVEDFPTRAEGFQDKPRKESEFTSEKVSEKAPQAHFETEVLGKPRVGKKKELKSKLKQGRATKVPEEPYFAPPLEERARATPRTPPEEDVSRPKWSFSPDVQRHPTEKARRRPVLSSPEGHDSPTIQRPSEERGRRVLVPPQDGSQNRDGRDGGMGSDVQYGNRGKYQSKRYDMEGSPTTPEYGHRKLPEKESRQVEKRRKVKEEGPPHSPSPEDISPRGTAVPPEEHRRERTPPHVDRRGPQTPPGEPDYDDDSESTADARSHLRRKRGPYTPPPPEEAIRTKVDKSRNFREGRSGDIRYRDDPDVSRIKERDEREPRYAKSRTEDRIDDFPRGERGQPHVEDDYTRGRGRDDEFVRARHRDDREEDYHQRSRQKDDRSDESYRPRDREPVRGNDYHRSRPEELRGDEHLRRKPDGSEDFMRRRDERDDDHLRVRNREPEKSDERLRRRDDRGDEYQRSRGREEHEDDSQRSRLRDYPRRQVEVGDERYWDRRGERETREPPYSERDRRRQELPRQDMQDNRGRERPGERQRERDIRHPPPGPEYHRRSSPPPQGPRRSPPHGPPRGRSPHRYEERRRSLSPGSRRDEGYRPGPRDQGGFGPGREPMRGRGGYSPAIDNRGRPVESRRRNSPPPRQYQERGRAAVRGRGGGGRGGRGFPDRMRPPGDRYREQPRDGGGPWDRERRPERDYPRDRGRPHDESRERDRRHKGELSPGRGPRHWEERKGGSPGRSGSPPRERRVQEPDRMPRETEDEHRRKTDEEEEEWEYEEDMGEETFPRHGERKRPRENASSVSRSASPVGGKRRRSETPEMKDASTELVADRTEKGEDEGQPLNADIPMKQTTKMKKKKEGKKEGTAVKSEGEAVSDAKLSQEGNMDSGIQPEGEKRVKLDKKHKKEKGKGKEKGAKKKKKSSNSAEASEATTEVAEVVTKEVEQGDAPSSDGLGEATERKDAEPKVTKKRKHAAAADEEGTKGKQNDKQPKKKKKKKHQPEVIVQPWADLEGDEADESNATDQERPQAQVIETDIQGASKKDDGEEETNNAVKKEGKTPETTEVDAPAPAKRIEEVFSDWSDDSPIGDDTWSDINEPTVADDKPKEDDQERKNTPSPGANTAPSFDDVYDPISDDELDAMLGDEEDDGGGRSGDSNVANSTTTPMPVEDVDWSALVSAQGTTEKKEEEPGSHLKKFTPGHVFSHIGISSVLAGSRLTKLVQESLVKKEPQPASCFGALMAGAAAKRRERETLFTNIGPCRRALCARRDLVMRKRLRRLSGKVGLFQTPTSVPVDNELYLMSVALYQHEPPATDPSSSSTKLIPSKVGSVLATVTS